MIHTGDWTRVDVGGWTVRGRRRDGLSGKIRVVFRPEALSLVGEQPVGADAIIGEAVVVTWEFLGAVVRYRLRLDDGRLVHLDEHKPEAARLHKEGARVRFLVRADDVMLFPAEEPS